MQECITQWLEVIERSLCAII